MAATDEEVVELLNAVKVATDREEKISLLTRIEDSLIRVAPALLPKYLDDVLSLQTDRLADVRAFIAGFIGDAFRLNASLLPRTTLHLRLLANDESPNVVKRVILTLSHILPSAFVAASAGSVEQATWNELVETADVLARSAESPNVGVRTHAIKFLQRLAQLFSSREDASPDPPNDPSPASVPASHPFLKTDDLHQLGQRYLDLFVQVLDARVDSMLACTMAAVASVPLLVKARRQFASVLIPALIRLVEWDAEGATASQRTSFYDGLRRTLTQLKTGSAAAAAPFSADIDNAVDELGELRTAGRDPAAAREARKRAREELEAASAPDIDESAGKVPRLADDADVKTLPPHVPDLAAVQSIPIEYAVPMVTQCIASVPPTQPHNFDHFHAIFCASFAVLTGTQAKPQVAAAAAAAVNAVAVQAARPAAPRKPYVLAVPERIEADGAAAAMLRDAFDRILEQQDAVKPFGRRADGWAILVKTVAARIVEDEEMVEGEEGSEESAFEAQAQSYMADRLLEYIAGRLGERVHLAAAWLMEEHRHAYNSATRYEERFDRLQAAYERGAESSDDIALLKLLELAPVLSDGTFSLVRRLCSDPKRLRLGIYVLRDIIDQREPFRARALGALLSYCADASRGIRSAAIVQARKWSPESTVGESVERFATSCLELVTAERLPVGGPAVALGVAQKEEEGDVDMEGEEHEGEHDGEHEGNGEHEHEQDGEHEGDHEENHENHEENEAIEASADGWTDATALPCVELYFSLCARKHSLFPGLVSVYERSCASVQTVMRTHIAGMVRAMGASATVLVDFVRNFTPAAEPLALKVVLALSETSAVAAIAPAVRSVVEERGIDPRFLLPVIPALTRSDIVALLPSIVLASTPAATSEVLTRLADPTRSSPVRPDELLVLLHQQEALDKRRLVQATQVCIANRAVYTQEVMAAVLKQLVQLNTVPTLTLRTAIVSLEAFPPLEPLMRDLLIRLVPKRVYESKILFDGFIKCAEKLRADSASVTLRLPQEYLEEALKKSAKLKDDVAQAMLRLPATERAARFDHIVKMLERLGVKMEAEQPAEVASEQVEQQ